MLARKWGLRRGVLAVESGVRRMSSVAVMALVQVDLAGQDSKAPQPLPLAVMAALVCCGAVAVARPRRLVAMVVPAAPAERAAQAP